MIQTQDYYIFFQDCQLKVQTLTTLKNFHFIELENRNHQINGTTQF